LTIFVLSIFDKLIDAEINVAIVYFLEIL